MQIPGFNDYAYLNGNVINKNNKVLKKITTKLGTYQYKMKRDNGRWTSVTESTLNSLVGNTIKLPSTAKGIPKSEGYFIDTDGTVFSFSRAFPQGKILTHTIGTAGYPRVKIDEKTMDVHTILARTFIMENYIEKGLVCRHKDDIKTNCHIDNLCVGTYSQNNKEAYARSLIKSKLGSAEHGVLSRKRVNWDSINLQSLLVNHNNNFTSVAKIIGCSANTIKKRLRKTTLLESPEKTINSSPTNKGSK